MRKKSRHPGLLAAIEAAGSNYALAKKLGITKAAVLKWRTIPAGRIIEVEHVTGIDRTVLRPDLYRRGD